MKFTEAIIVYKGQKGGKGLRTNNAEPKVNSFSSVYKIR